MKTSWCYALVIACLGLLAAPAAADTFTVDSTANDPDASPGDGVCASAGGACTLYAALEEANARVGDHTIAFDIPGGGVHTITGPAFGLPIITRANLTIDGYQPVTNGSQPNTNATGGLNTVLRVELLRTDQPCLSTQAQNTTIRGLSLRGVTEIRAGAGGNGLVVEGNFIGTDAAGTPMVQALSSSGVRLDQVTGAVIGGTTPAARNLISGNNYIGIEISRSGGTGTYTIQGNLIGTDRTGTVALPNQHAAIQVNGDGGAVVTGLIGGAEPGAGNVISGNTNETIRFSGFRLSDQFFIDGTVIRGNLIGTDATGTAPLSNDSDAAISLLAGPRPGSSVTIEDNVLAHDHPGVGVAVGSSFLGVAPSGIRILGNSMYANDGLGIDLGGDGVTANDADDSDTGANERQNFPVLDADPDGASASGTLDSTPATTFHVEVFASTSCDPSGYGEGETFLGSTDVATDGSGHATFALVIAPPVPAGRYLTATATDPDGNTSEFSACVQVAAPPTTTTATTTTTTSTSTTSTSTTVATTSTTTTATTATTSSTTSTTVPVPAEVCDDAADNDGDGLTDCADPDCASLPGCAAGCPAGATFVAIDCRLDALVTRVQTSTEIGAQQAQLVDQLVKARERKRQAEALCRDADTRHARNRLKQAIRKTIQYGHRLRSRAAKRSIATALRSELIADGEEIRDGLKALKGALRCPEDAPAA